MSSDGTAISTRSGAKVSDVRMELSDTEGVIDETVIVYHLGRADEYVVGNAPDTTTPSDLEAAVALEAACRVVGSNRDFFVTKLRELDVSKDINVEAWISDLEKRRDKEVSTKLGQGTPKLFTFGGR